MAKSTHKRCIIAQEKAHGKIPEDSMRSKLCFLVDVSCLLQRVERAEITIDTYSTKRRGMRREVE